MPVPAGAEGHSGAESGATRLPTEGAAVASCVPLRPPTAKTIHTTAPRLANSLIPSPPVVPRLFDRLGDRVTL